MPVKAIRPEYSGIYRDGVEHFNGQQLISICWERHTMMGWPMCIPVSPGMTFGDLVKNVIPAIFSIDPDFKDIEWDKVHWSTAHGSFIPDFNKTLEEQGFRHKEQIRFRTPIVTNRN